MKLTTNTFVCLAGTVLALAHADAVTVTVGHDQSTDLNFSSYAGFGLDRHLDKHHSIGMIYAVRHFSNASVREPNNGVNIDAWFATYTWRD